MIRRHGSAKNVVRAAQKLLGPGPLPTLFDDIRHGGKIYSRLMALPPASTIPTISAKKKLPRMAAPKPAPKPAPKKPIQLDLPGLFDD